VRVGAGLAVALAAIGSAGCITRAGGALAPLVVTPPAEPPTLEDTVGDYEFTLEGGKMITSNKAGRTLNDEVLRRWKKKGYIAGSEYVPSGQFSGKADYNLVLMGSQYGEASLVEELISGLTLYLLPYTIDHRYDVQYVLENVHTGERYAAQVEDSFRITVELLLVFAAPVATRGADATFDAMADHLYYQLQQKGAFAPAAAGDGSPP
jgi:hypothetical protein